VALTQGTVKELECDVWLFLLRIIRDSFTVSPGFNEGVTKAAKTRSVNSGFSNGRREVGTGTLTLLCDSHSS
jgi:hypothetical protein